MDREEMKHHFYVKKENIHTAPGYKELKQILLSFNAFFLSLYSFIFAVREMRVDSGKPQGDNTKNMFMMIGRDGRFAARK